MRRQRFLLLGLCLMASAALANCAGPAWGEPTAITREAAPSSPTADAQTKAFSEESKADSLKEESIQIQYLEIVTPDVDATCAAYTQLHGVSFGDPEAGLGNARTATLSNGGRIGVRAPMHEAEEPVVRPYLLVDDIEAAIEAAQVAGGQIAHPPLEIPGHGKFAIYILGGIQHGLWQL